MALNNLSLRCLFGPSAFILPGSLGKRARPVGETRFLTCNSE